MIWQQKKKILKLTIQLEVVLECTETCMGVKLVVDGDRSPVPVSCSEAEPPQESELDDRALAVVGKCFKFVNAFTREKVETVVGKYYQNSQANLALIEIALYDHETVKKRNSHKAFLDALIAWGILNMKNAEEYNLILFGIKDKHKRLPKAGGYLDWPDDYLQNEKNICISIGQELGDTMPYRYKKQD